mmetsp:Transcript_13981/g.43327  ORF Transcript_13981/g.43327 Transcript_13981/m.43327 type:complete len:272 (+) Transcript_13981:385-1200(+)
MCAARCAPKSIEPPTASGAAADRGAESDRATQAMPAAPATAAAARTDVQPRRPTTPERWQPTKSITARRTMNSDSHHPSNSSTATSALAATNASCVVSLSKNATHSAQRSFRDPTGASMAAASPAAPPAAFEAIGWLAPALPTGHNSLARRGSRATGANLLAHDVAAVTCLRSKSHQLQTHFVSTAPHAARTTDATRFGISACHPAASPRPAENETATTPHVKTSRSRWTNGRRLLKVGRPEHVVVRGRGGDEGCRGGDAHVVRVRGPPRA